jgi:hypothetical protein
LSLLVIINKVFNISNVLIKLVIRMLLLLKRVFSDLLLHIIKGLKERKAQSSQSKNSSEFDSVLNSNRKAVKSQVLIKSIS